MLVRIVHFCVSAVVSESFRERISVDFELCDGLILVRRDCNELRLPKRERRGRIAAAVHVHAAQRIALERRAFWNLKRFKIETIFLKFYLDNVDSRLVFVHRMKDNLSFRVVFVVRQFQLVEVDQSSKI